MRVVLAIPGREPQALTFGDDTTVADLRAIVAAELGVDDVSAVQLLVGGRPLGAAGTAALSSLGLQEGETIRGVLATPSPAALPAANVMADQLQRFFSGNTAPGVSAPPEPAPAPTAMLQQGLQAFFSTPAAREQQRRLELVRRLEENPLDLEAQELLAELIREANVEQNYEYAMENNPECFVRVHMLFCRCAVNGIPLLAMVDTGAETSIMSLEFAEKSELMRLVDRRYKGLARGVGEAKIVGRVHCAPIKIGGAVLPCAFTIVEGAHLDFLLGLDLLRRHQCVVDIKANALRIGAEAVPFLEEKDIPHNPKLDSTPDKGGSE